MEANTNGSVEHTDSKQEAQKDVTTLDTVKDKAIANETDCHVMDRNSNADTRYGCGNWKPSGFQFFNKIQLFVLWACILCFMEGYAINGLPNINLPTIERRFELPSSQSALIASGQDIGAICVVLFVSYIGSRGRKPSWVATGSLIMSIGSLLFMVPHFASNIYDYSVKSLGGGNPQGMCVQSQSNTTAQCSDTGTPKIGAEAYFLGVIIFGNVLHGIGFAPMFTLGTAYIDQNERHGTAAIYIGFTYAAAAVGVAVGFFSGGQYLSNFYVDFDRVDVSSVEITNKDLRWVGAWWLGFSVSCIGFALVAIPLYGYPSSLPDAEDKKPKAAIKPKIDAEEDTLCNCILGFPKGIFKLLRNVTFLFITLGGTMESMIIAGIATFATKYLYEQYGLFPNSIGIIMGCLIIFGSGGGMILGGVLVRVLKLEGIGTTRICAAFAFLSAAVGFALFAYCPEIPLAGLKVPYPGESSISGYSVPCLSGCACADVPFQPVCGSDGVVYYSPCHAGCTGTNTTGGPMSMVFTDCGCVGAGSQGSSLAATAANGRCPEDCGNIYILVPFLFAMLLATFTTTTANSMATLRSVPNDMSSFALGVQWMIMRLLGILPGPILIGFIFDVECAIWQEDGCGNTGSCLMYNREATAMNLMIWWVVVNGVGGIFYIIASLTFKKKNNYSVEYGEEAGSS